MKKWKSNLFPVITLAVCLGLAACGGGRKPLEITVVNRTTYPVEDIRIRETDGKDWGENRLETTLAQGESIKIDLGNIRWKNWTEVFRFSYTVRMKSR
ncbi:MAG: hypothetical protein V8S93_06680 [Lachnospiraceae bacterium]